MIKHVLIAAALTTSLFAGAESKVGSLDSAMGIPLDKPLLNAKPNELQSKQFEIKPLRVERATLETLTDKNSIPVYISASYRKYSQDEAAVDFSTIAKTLVQKYPSVDFKTTKYNATYSTIEGQVGIFNIRASVSPHKKHQGRTLHEIRITYEDVAFRKMQQNKLAEML